MTETDQATDPHLWLEEVEGDKALGWVRAQNDRTLADLRSDPDYEAFEAAATEVLTSKERIPYGRIEREERRCGEIALVASKASGEGRGMH